MMTTQDDGSHRVGPMPLDMRTDANGDVVVPVIAEEIEVTARKVETGRVRITKEVHEREVLVEEPVARELVHVERVTLNQVVTERPVTRQEGDALIVPIVEEILVVEKRLVLKEELRITRTRVVGPTPAQHVTLRNEEVRVDRVPTREQKDGAPD